MTRRRLSYGGAGLPGCCERASSATATSVPAEPHQEDCLTTSEVAGSSLAGRIALLAFEPPWRLRGPSLRSQMPATARVAWVGPLRRLLITSHPLANPLHIDPRRQQIWVGPLRAGCHDCTIPRRHIGRSHLPRSSASDPRNITQSLAPGHVLGNRGIAGGGVLAAQVKPPQKGGNSFNSRSTVSTTSSICRTWRRAASCNSARRVPTSFRPTHASSSSGL